MYAKNKNIGSWLIYYRHQKEFKCPVIQSLYPDGRVVSKGGHQHTAICFFEHDITLTAEMKSEVQARVVEVLFPVTVVHSATSSYLSNTNDRYK